MALTLLEAAKGSQNKLTRGIITQIATVDELTAMLKWEPIYGDAELFDREKALPDFEFVEDGDTISESTGTLDEIALKLRELTSDMDMSVFSILQQMGENPKAAQQLRMKLKALGRKIGATLVTGKHVTGTTIEGTLTGVAIPAANVGPMQDTTRFGPAIVEFDVSDDRMRYMGPGDVRYGEWVTIGSPTDGSYTLYSDNPHKWVTVVVTAASLPATDVQGVVTFQSTSKEFDGFPELCAASQVIASTGPNGDALSFGAMDRLIDTKVLKREGRVFVGNGQIKAKFLELLRSAGGNTAGTFAIPGFNGNVPTYRGIPFLQNDNIPSDESKGSGTTLSSLYLASLDEDEGLRMNCGQSGQTLNLDLDPRDAVVMGINIRDLGERETVSKRRTRISSYCVPRLGSELALGRISELVTAP